MNGGIPTLSLQKLKQIVVEGLRKGGIGGELVGKLTIYCRMCSVLNFKKGKRSKAKSTVMGMKTGDRTMKVDVFITGVCVDIPDGTDLNTDEGYLILKEAVKQKYLEILNSGFFCVDDYEIVYYPVESNTGF